MSMGYWAFAEKIESDDPDLVEYEYRCYNQNIPGQEKYKEIDDGKIIIKTESIAENQNFPGNRYITVKNAGGTWKVDPQGTDVMAKALIRKIINAYQTEGNFPARVSWSS